MIMTKAAGKIKAREKVHDRFRSVGLDVAPLVPNVKIKDKDKDKHQEKESSKHQKKDKDKHQDKDKEKDKDKNASKEKKGAKKKKLIHGSSVASAGEGGVTSANSSEESNGSRANSQTVFEEHSDVHRVKGRKISKECEEAVNMAVFDFFGDAWTVCVERFFINAASAVVSYELRNTWLRIVEAEWQDPDMREKPGASVKHNRIFKRDEPPLPLAFDSWSRGAVEEMPKQRRESVMDPFLRDFDVIRHLPYRKSVVVQPPVAYSAPSSTTTTDIMDFVNAEEFQEKLAEEEEQEAEEEEATEPEPVDSKTAAQPVGEKWDFALDPPLMPLKAPTISDAESTTDWSLISSEFKLQIPPPVLEREEVFIMLSPRPLSWNESATENYSSEGDAKKKRKQKKDSQNVVKRFSPSQCGGKAGSGVFRLLNQTTASALESDWTETVRSTGSRRATTDIKIDVDQLSGLDDHEGSDHEVKLPMASTQSLISSKDNESESEEVQPLFEERTFAPRPTEMDNSYALRPTFWRRPSYLEEHERSRARGAPSLEEVASDINNRSLKRRVVNLMGRFKRQAMRSLAERARRIEDLRRHSSSLFSKDFTSDSSSVIHNQTNVTKKTAKHSKVEKGLQSQSRSASNFTVTRANSIFSESRSVAKSTVSEPRFGSGSTKSKRGQHSKRPTTEERPSKAEKSKKDISVKHSKSETHNPPAASLPSNANTSNVARRSKSDFSVTPKSTAGKRSKSELTSATEVATRENSRVDARSNKSDFNVSNKKATGDRNKNNLTTPSGVSTRENSRVDARSNKSDFNVNNKKATGDRNKNNLTTPTGASTRENSRVAVATRRSKSEAAASSPRSVGKRSKSEYNNANGTVTRASSRKDKSDFQVVSKTAAGIQSKNEIRERKKLTSASSIKRSVSRKSTYNLSTRASEMRSRASFFRQTPTKRNFVTSMGNVQATNNIHGGTFRNYDKYEDPKDSQNMHKLRARFENSAKFSRSGENGWAEEVDCKPVVETLSLSDCPSSTDTCGSRKARN